jgi:hypothetical protein
MEDRRDAYRIGWKFQRETDHLEGLGIHGRVMLQRIFKQ